MPAAAAAAAVANVCRSQPSTAVGAGGGPNVTVLGAQPGVTFTIDPSGYLTRQEPVMIHNVGEQNVSVTQA